MMTKSTRQIALLALILLTLAACTAPQESTPAATPVPSITAPPTSEPAPVPVSGAPVLLSEVLGGIQGNNNYEFIELYNPGAQAQDLKGWSIWYRLPNSQQDLFVYRWQQETLLAPQAHFLLGRAGETLSTPPDAEFEQALNIGGGWLELRTTDGTPIDALAWGNMPAPFGEQSPAPALPNGTSLERLPGGERGNAYDSNHNAQDFALNPSPNPQNSRSPLTPLAQQRLEVTLNAPNTAEPGSKFTYTLTVNNLTGKDLQNVRVRFPIPQGLELTGTPPQTTLEAGALLWQVDALPQGETAELAIPIQVPWTYFTATAANYTAQAQNWEQSAYGGMVHTVIAGGRVPIGTARTLLNAEVTIEGIATAYTGAYFAGNGNVKFYLQDETGGIQVQVFGGQGNVAVRMGQRVRVRGTIGVYRDSVQIVPIRVPEDVEILAGDGETPQPPLKSATAAESTTITSRFAGQAIALTGDIVRIDEFTYSYEIDLAADGKTLTLYVDKQTGIEVDTLAVGQRLTAAGILDARDGKMLLYPRIASDLTVGYPPGLRTELNAPITVAAGAPVTVTLTVFNHAPILASGATLSLTLPTETRTWSLADLPAGASTTVSLTLTAPAKGWLQLARYGASAPGVAALPAIPFYIFVGEGVPIWAIQGEGYRSPYVGKTVTTEGAVTAVFPELGGFWLQELVTDDNPATSAGIFVQMAEPPVNAGDWVRVTGRVRETAQQTSLQVSGAAGVIQLASRAPLPAPVELDPPSETRAALTYYESLEGMLVQVTQPTVAVSPVNKYGETSVVLQKHALARLMQGDEARNGWQIMFDDGSNATYEDRADLPFVVTSGDTVTGLLGPLAFTYEKYKIEPILPPQITPGGFVPTPISPLAEGEFRLMTWNVENLFDARDPHPTTSPPKPRLSKYQNDLEKVAATIELAGFPTVIALQEVENYAVLEDLATLESLAAYGYQPALLEGFDSRGIDVGYLVRGDAEILELTQYDAPEGLTSRPPLLLKVQIGDVVWFVVNNHFTSMSGGELATEPRRTAQAAWNVEILRQLQADDPQARVAIVGDLNSYYDSPPIDTLRAAGLLHVLEILPPEARYTYIYQGVSQVLDHILITPSLNQLLRRVEILHVNSDFPVPFADDPSAEHKSDHDPVVVTFGE